MLTKHCSSLAALFLCHAVTGQEPAKKPNEDFDPRSHRLRLLAEVSPVFANDLRG